MPHLPFHPAPGFGDLLPGMFVVPQNPIRDAGTPLVPSVQAANQGRVAYRPKMGDLLPGMFVVPQNPIINNMATGMQGMGAGMSGMGCGCGGGCSGRGYTGGYDQYGFNASGLQGLGDVSSTISDIGTWMSGSMVAGIPNWALVAAGVAAYMLMAPGGSEYRQKARALRSQYRGYKRAAGAIA